MIQFRRRVLGVTIGLALGWSAAGYWSSTTLAQEPDPHHQDHHWVDVTSEGVHDPIPHPATHTGEHDAHSQELDQGQQAAAQLVPHPGQVDWYPSVLMALGGLFAAAVVLGVPALKLAAPDKAEPANDDSHTGAGH